MQLHFFTDSGALPMKQDIQRHENALSSVLFREDLVVKGNASQKCRRVVTLKFLQETLEGTPRASVKDVRQNVSPIKWITTFEESLFMRMKLVF